MEYFRWSGFQNAHELYLKYPGKINIHDRYLGTCPECGDQYTSNRYDKRTCGSTCRQRQKRRLAKLPTTERIF